MSDLFLLSESHLERIEPYFPLSHGLLLIDDRKALTTAALWAAFRQWPPTRRTLDPDRDDGMAFDLHLVELRISGAQQALGLPVLGTTMQDDGLTTQHHAIEELW